MIKYIHGDLLTTDAIVIVHGCNCSGGFGSGVAGAIAAKYPYVRQKYFEHKNKVLGTIQVVTYNEKYWINAFTQEGFGSDGQVYANIEAIRSCMIELRMIMKAAGVEFDIAMPKIGCGLGGLKWVDVEPIIDEVFGDCNYDIYVYDINM